MTPEVPLDRATSPDSLAAMALRLETRIDESQQRTQDMLLSIKVMLENTLNEALLVKQENSDIKDELAKVKNLVDAIDLWRKDTEARLRALEATP